MHKKPHSQNHQNSSHPSRPPPQREADELPTTQTAIEIDQLAPDFRNIICERQPGESLVISDPVTLKILAIITISELRTRSRIKVACRVPRDVGIDRDTVFLSKLNNKKKSEGNE